MPAMKDDAVLKAYRVDCIAGKRAPSDTSISVQIVILCVITAAKCTENEATSTEHQPTKSPQRGSAAGFWFSQMEQIS